MNETNNILKTEMPNRKSGQFEPLVMPTPNTFENKDCMSVLPFIPDEYFDLAIVDPPYGINIAKNFDHYKGGTKSWKKHKNKDWDKTTPPKEYFWELKRVAKNQIIFGANYFIYNLPSITKGWIVWDKVNHELTMSDCEIIYTSFNCKTKVYKENFGTERGVNNLYGDIHPTQKSTRLYKWLLRNYAKAGDFILDTHVGSGSSLIACIELGFNYYGTEIDKEYFDSASVRISKAYRKYELFGA